MIRVMYRFFWCWERRVGKAESCYCNLMGNVQCIDLGWENCCDDELLGGSEKDKENSSFVCLLNVLRRKGADTFQNGKFTLFPPRHTVA